MEKLFVMRVGLELLVRILTVNVLRMDCVLMEFVLANLDLMEINVI
jgi:hypothetical protein